MEIFFVEAEYTDKLRGTVQTTHCGWSSDYEKAKKRCHEVVEEDRGEGEFPEDYEDGWNEKYEDEFCYEDEMTRVLIAVYSMDEIE